MSNLLVFAKICFETSDPTSVEIKFETLFGDAFQYTYNTASKEWETFANSLSITELYDLNNMYVEIEVTKEFVPIKVTRFFNSLQECSDAISKTIGVPVEHADTLDSIDELNEEEIYLLKSEIELEIQKGKTHEEISCDYGITENCLKTILESKGE